MRQSIGHLPCSAPAATDHPTGTIATAVQDDIPGRDRRAVSRRHSPAVPDHRPLREARGVKLARRCNRMRRTGYCENQFARPLLKSCGRSPAAASSAPATPESTRQAAPLSATHRTPQQWKEYQPRRQLPVQQTRPKRRGRRAPIAQPQSTRNHRQHHPQQQHRTPPLSRREPVARKQRSEVQAHPLMATPKRSFPVAI